jgi:predicted flap endonuclease-1-like 5' DNA nuclease
MKFDTTIIAIIVAVLAAAVLALILLRSRGRARPIARRTEGESPYVASRDRPYMRQAVHKDGPQGNSVADEVATATTDVAGEILGVHPRPDGTAPADDLSRIKGVGPKMVARLHELGITRYVQLAGLNENEVAHLDGRLGAFQGRLVRDRVVEQACFLERGDIDGFEAKFGKLGS